ncbi:MAG: antibiotic ABC transporter ATP-binding protein [Candidatus Nephrothrix sp. EaCA]|nr:MAG: antibiotic ABC transporter ATP-binding protein [Candidatus Nephrothrix sp. EaCA]
MKTFLRVLQYARELPLRLLLFFIYSALGIIFGAFNLLLAIPMLNALFNYKETSMADLPAFPEFAFSVEYGKNLFNYYFMRTMAEGGASRTLLFICVLLLVCVVLANLFRYLERVMATKIRVDIVKNLRMHIFENITLFHIGFFNTERRGDLISRFTSDVGMVESGVTDSLKAVLKEPITILVYFGILFTLSFKLTLFTVLVLPLAGGIVSEIIKRLKREARWGQESLGRIVNILDETFGGMRVIKAFNARPYILNKMEDESIYFRKVSKSMAYKNELASPVSEILGVMIITGILYYGGHLVLGKNATLEPGAFMGFLAIFASIIQPIKNFSSGITALQRGIVAAHRVFDLIDKKPLIQSRPGAVKLEKFEKELEFKDISFAYHADLVLKNINLKIEKGKTVALVGTSGGGKSTLADLVPRFYDPSSGALLADGTDVRNYDLESWRKQLGIVTQESILFNDTIFNNIAFGMPQASEEAVIDAAKIAYAHDFIMQSENGYQTVIGERGSKLSGGQRQRLSIARAVLKNPAILILDEATSALDSESEKWVQEAIFNLMKDRTCIVIAHRLSTIQHADEIIVIQDGMIVERGRHDELIRHDGLYKKLNSIQSTDKPI